MDSQPSSSFYTAHDVFLSYHAHGTLKNFTGHLYKSLTQSKIHTFTSHHSPPIGSDTSIESINAIAESKDAVIVFLKNYFKSSRCRDEFVRIVECGRTVGQFVVVAVYFDISRIDLREEIGGGFDGTNYSEWDLNAVSDG